MSTRLALAMRFSGLLLTLLVAAAIYSAVIVDEGPSRLGYAWLVSRWSNIWWRSADILMTWLALLHGAAGIRAMILASGKPIRRQWWQLGVVYALTLIALVLGTVTILTFDPNATS